MVICAAYASTDCPSKLVLVGEDLVAGVPAAFFSGCRDLRLGSQHPKPLNFQPSPSHLAGQVVPIQQAGKLGHICLMAFLPEMQASF